MKYIISISIILTFCLPLLLLPTTVSALGFGDAQEQLETAGGEAYGDVSETTIEDFVGDIINTLLSLTGVIFICLIVYGGYLWMTAQGHEDQIKKATSVLRAAFIGIIIVVLAYGITYFVIEQLLSNTSTEEAVNDES